MTKVINGTDSTSKNVKTAVILFTIALAFFAGVIAKHILFNG